MSYPTLSPNSRVLKAENIPKISRGFSQPEPKWADVDPPENWFDCSSCHGSGIASMDGNSFFRTFVPWKVVKRLAGTSEAEQRN
jgi:hypothetical protein